MSETSTLLEHGAADLATLRARCQEAFIEETLPVKGIIIVGDGPAALATKFNLIVATLAERHKEGTTPVLRSLMQISKGEDFRSAGGEAWFGQDGALNSGFSDLMILPDLDYLSTHYRQLNYQPLRDLARSLKDATNRLFAGTHKDLIEEFGKRNQAGANILASQVKDGEIDTTRAALLRYAAFEVMHDMNVLLDNFITTHVFEIVVFRQLYNTEALSWSYDESTQAITITARKIGSANQLLECKTHIVVDVTGTLTKPLVKSEIAKTACTGPANADSIRKNLLDHSRLNEDGSVKDGTVMTIIGQELHGYDYATVGLTVIGANIATGDEREPWTADPKFAQKKVTMRLMARDGCNLPPPRLNHDKIWNGEQPLLTTSHAIAASLYQLDDYPGYERVRDHAISRALEVHPADLPVDRTSADQLRRYGDEIERFEAGELTFTELEEKFALCRQFVEIPSRDPARAQADAKARFPYTYQNAANRYTSRYAGITTSYLRDNASNAQTMANERRNFTVFASAPLATVKMLCQHHNAGSLQLVKGDAEKITREGGIYKTEAGDSHIILSPPLIANKPSDFVMSNPDIIRDGYGCPVVCKQRKLCLRSGESIPFYVYGNSLNGQPFVDETGKTSICNRFACDVATLFANFAGNKAALSASIGIDIKILARQRTHPGRAWERLIEKHCKPTKAQFEADLRAALPLVQEQQQLEVFLRQISRPEVRAYYSDASGNAQTISRRNAYMTEWQSGDAAQTRVAADYFAEINSLPEPIPKTLGEWWAENVELRLDDIGAAYDEILCSNTLDA